MSHDSKFAPQITQFQRYGTYIYRFDEAGNIVVNPDSNDFSQVYLSFPLSNYVYDNSKIIGFYDPTFTEFVPQAADTQLTEEDVSQMQMDLETEKFKNVELLAQLESMIEASGNNGGIDPTAAKQVILELRKALGQGRVDSDFSEDFPYAPFKKTTSLASTSAVSEPSITETSTEQADSVANKQTTITSTTSGAGSSSTTTTTTSTPTTPTTPTVSSDPLYTAGGGLIGSSKFPIIRQLN